MLCIVMANLYHALGLHSCFDSIFRSSLSRYQFKSVFYNNKDALLQNMFILNVAASDVLISMIGIVRGLGIISPKFVGHNGEKHEESWWCSAFTFTGNTLW